MAHYLVTGHTGFKGSWLSVLLGSRGHAVSGISLDAQPGSLFSRALTPKDFSFDLRLDIRDKESVSQAFRKIQPDFVVHLAAQSLVREGYRAPLLTYETNVLGTLNVLAALQSMRKVKAALIVTSDKVYQNTGTERPYRETDPLGGQDPYSASKAMADIATQEFQMNRSVSPIGIARAGNVIGAGDVSVDRLLPDFVRSVNQNQPMTLRYPAAVRPWQHVLDCLEGYLLLLDKLSTASASGAYNFGPLPAASSSVQEVAEVALTLLGHKKLKIEHRSSPLKEDPMLLVDASKARSQLGWIDRFTVEEAIRDGLFDALNAGKAPILEHMLSTVSSWDR